MLRRKSVIISLAITFTLLITSAVMAAPPSGADKPWDRVWSAIEDLQAQIDEIPAAAVPEGTIVMWSGTLSSIPDGWALCDGTQGTPDLTDTFILGVSDSEEPGAFGGTEGHIHAGVPHSHNATISPHTHFVNPSNTSTTSSGSHAHTATVGGPSATTDVISTLGTTAVAAPSHNHSVSLSSTGTHTHGVNVPGTTTSSAGGGANPTSSDSAATQMTDHLPPYFKLAFIMKLAESL